MTDEMQDYLMHMLQVVEANPLDDQLISYYKDIIDFIDKAAKSRKLSRSRRDILLCQLINFINIAYYNRRAAV